MCPHNSMIGPSDEQDRTLHHSIIGFRRWKLDRTGDTPGLRSPFIPEVTWDREMQAKCVPYGSKRLRFPHESPHKNCQCGLYAYYDLPSKEHALYGAVAAVGKVQVHATGFRAEKLRLIALGYPEEVVGLDNEPRRAVVEKIAETYGVPVLEREDLRTYALEFGAEMPDRLKPQPTDEPNPMPALQVVDEQTLAAAMAGTLGVMIGTGLLLWRVVRRG